MQLQHMIVDDFFSDPMKMRELALSNDFPERHANEVYPGRNSTHLLDVDGINQVICNIVQEPLTPMKHSSHLRPRLALEGDVGRDMSVHMDMCHWSAIVYLSLDEHCEGGTHFFRHNQTGWETAPVWPGMAEAAGYPNPDAALKAVMTQTNDPSAWTETMMLPMKFNRLVLFRGYLWHDAGRSFGTSKENGRLILPLFYDIAN